MKAALCDASESPHPHGGMRWLNDWLALDVVEGELIEPEIERQLLDRLASASCPLFFRK